MFRTTKWNKGSENKGHENVRQLKRNERLNLTVYNIKILNYKYKGQI